MRKIPNKPAMAEKKISTYHLVDNPKGGWISIDDNLRSSIELGNRKVTGWSGKLIRTATAYLNDDNPKKITLDRVVLLIWKFDDNGLLDLNDQAIRFAEAEERGECPSEELIPTKRDIVAIKRCLGF